MRWLRPEEELLVLEVMPSPFREIAKRVRIPPGILTRVPTLRRGRNSPARLAVRSSKSGPRRLSCSSLPFTIPFTIMVVAFLSQFGPV